MLLRNYTERMKRQSCFVLRGIATVFNSFMRIIKASKHTRESTHSRLAYVYICCQHHRMSTVAKT